MEESEKLAERLAEINTLSRRSPLCSELRDERITILNKLVDGGFMELDDRNCYMFVSDKHDQIYEKKLKI